MCMISRYLLTEKKKRLVPFLDPCSSLNIVKVVCMCTRARFDSETAYFRLRN